METSVIVQYTATLCFSLAILHTFLVKKIQNIAHRYPEDSVSENFFHLLGEVEVVFGIWAGFFLLFYLATDGPIQSLNYLESRNFSEPIFVFVIMAVCSSRPLLIFGQKLIALIGQLLPMNKTLGFYFAALTVGPLLGSFITEPAAMTITALILLNSLFRKTQNEKLKYATLGLLFVNISIGGTLTPYAAPPVLMVAPVWNWDIFFMLSHFGWKAFLAIIISTSWITYKFKEEIKSTAGQSLIKFEEEKIPPWIVLIHLLVLISIILASHHLVLFMGAFLFFLGVTTVTKEFQSELNLRDSLLVGFFLAGLVILGGLQRWWLEPLVSSLTSLSLYCGSMFLTAFTDNAAITYLGSQIPDLADSSKYTLLAGSVVGGGLTVIANAPNPAGYSILNPSFGENGISAFSLFKGALLPTVVAAVVFWFL